LRSLSAEQGPHVIDAALDLPRPLVCLH
jgi:hypothetical protein